MREILANNLQSLFDNTSLNGKCTYRGNTYEVWEVSDEDFKIMYDMTEEEFEKVCPNGMWRSSDGSALYSPNYTVIINGKKLLGWIKEQDIYGACIAVGKSYIKEKEFRSLLEYFCDYIETPQPSNVCALAVDLAKANNMKMSELFEFMKDNMRGGLNDK